MVGARPVDSRGSSWPSPSWPAPSGPASSSSRTRPTSPSVGGRVFASTRGRDRVGPGRPDRHSDARAVGGRHVHDPADRRRQADADPAAHRPARLEGRAGRGVRDGLGVPRRADRRPAHGRGGAGPERAGDVRLVLRRRGGGAGQPAGSRDHRRRPEPPRADGPSGSTSSSPTRRRRSRAPVRPSSRHASTTRPAATT